MAFSAIPSTVINLRYWNKIVEEIDMVVQSIHFLVPGLQAAHKLFLTTFIRRGIRMTRRLISVYKWVAL